MSIGSDQTLGSSCRGARRCSRIGTAESSCTRRTRTLRWDKAAPFPEPEEELYGVAVGRQDVRHRRLQRERQARAGHGVRVRPGPDKWTKKKPIPVPVHHQAQTVLNGKIYVFGGCQRPLTGPAQAAGSRWTTRGNTTRWPTRGKALAPMPGKRCSAIAENVGGKIYVIGGATIMDNTG